MTSTIDFTVNDEIHKKERSHKIVFRPKKIREQTNHPLIEKDYSAQQDCVR